MGDLKSIDCVAFFYQGSKGDEYLAKNKFIGIDPDPDFSKNNY